MKKSHIFWNLMIILVEVIIGLICFGFEPEIFGYFTVVFGGLHSFLLIGMMFDGVDFKEDDFFPAFLFFSIVGGICIIIGGIIFLIIKIGESKFNPVKPIIRWLGKFNKWLDGEK